MKTEIPELSRRRFLVQAGSGPAAADVFAGRVQEAAGKYSFKPEQTFTGLSCGEKMIAKGGLDAAEGAAKPGK